MIHMQTYQTIFHHLGLSENEIRVYKTLLHVGPSSISAIMVRTKLHRPSTYRAIDALVEKQLVTVTLKGKRRLYAPASPSLLRGRLEEEMQQLVAEITPLEYLYEKRPQKPTVTFIEGKKAIAQAYLAIPRSLKKGDIFYRYSARDVVNRKEQIDKRVIAQYRKERDAKQLERCVITSDVNMRSKRSDLSRAIKIVPSAFDLFDHDVSQVIYGDNILLIDYNSDTAIHIQNPILAHFQRRIFQLLFKLLPATK